MIHVSPQANAFIQKNALMSGVINAVINGVIGWFMFQQKDALPLKLLIRYQHLKKRFSQRG
jgi:uncharacterized membrane-anchored protein